MIKKISFRNYKIFKDQQHLEIRPLTVIFGKNNSGKSAVAKLPVLLEAAFSTEAREALDLTYDGVEFAAELHDIIYGKANRVLEIDLEFQENTQLNRLATGILVAVDKGIQTSIIDHWRLNDEIDLQYTGDNQIYVDGISGIKMKCGFRGLNLISCIPLDDNISGFVFPKFTAMFLTDFIGPIRVRPQRDYRLTSNAKNGKSGPQGENSYLNLIEDALTTEKTLTKKVGAWYRDNFEGWTLTINQDKAPIFQIELQRETLKQNILDTGIGMSQVLPVVTRALSPCEAKTLIIIEEPETHLHPAAHGNLAELIADTVNNEGRSYLVETHSLNFILRLRRLVAEGRLAPENVSLYYVNFLEEENCSVLQQISLDRMGRVSFWPETVFNETLEETIGIRNAQLDQKAE